MSRRAALLVAAALGLSACHVTLNFGGADASSSCTTDKDCPLTSLHCEPFSGQCLACASDSDCASTAGRPHCDSVLHACVQCAGNQDCGSGSKCISTTRTCVRTCAAATDCAPSGGWCDDSICAQCDDSFHCSGTRPYCDPASYQCTACVIDAQCPTAAAPRCNRTTGQCVGCVTSADCGGAVCDPTDSTCKSVNP